MHQGRGGGEGDLHAPMAGRQSETQGGMGVSAQIVLTNYHAFKLREKVQLTNW